MSRRLVDGQMPTENTYGGRKPLLELDPDIAKKIVQAIRLGVPPLTAAALQGLNYDSVRNWVIKGKERPESIYGAFLVQIDMAMSEWETRTVSVIDAHAHGRPATYEMEVARDNDGNAIFNKDGTPIMQIARDGDGHPVLKSPAIKSDWRAAMEMLQRRKPKHWASNDKVVDVEAILTFDNTEVGTKETLTFEQQVAEANRRLEEDV